MAQHPITQVEFHPSRNARLGVDSIAPYVVAVVPRQQPDTLQLVKSEPFLGFELDPRALEKLPKPERDNFFAEMLLLDAMTRSLQAELYYRMEKLQRMARAAGRTTPDVQPPCSKEVA